MNRLNRRVVGVVLLSLYLVGCYKYTTVAGDPREAVASEPSWLRVTDTQGGQVILRSPVIRNDSITQLEAEPCQVVAYQKTVCNTVIPSVALDAVSLMEVREVQSGIIALVVVGGAAFTVFLVRQIEFCPLGSTDCG